MPKHEPIILELFDNRPYMWGWEKHIDEGGRKPARFTFIQTGAAAAIIPIRREAGTLLLFLIEEMRYEVGKPQIKTIGGYNNANESDENCIKRKAIEEAGIKVSDIKPLGKMVGYPTIVTPINLYFSPSSGWSFLPNSCSRAKIISLHLEEATEKAMRGEFCDDAAVASVMFINVLEQKGAIPK